MLFSGPGIKAGSRSDFLGTQVDLAPTMLGLAGIPKPSYMDGKSLVSLIVTESDHSLLPAAVAQSLSAAATLPSREASFVEYYNQGPWEVGKRHALDDWSNTYIGLNVRSAKWGSLKYGEYDPYGKQSNFSSVYFFELFNLTADPFELDNIYNDSAAELRDWLHSTVRAFYLCSGNSCM
jgi:N-acetylglucosamine-6-sulfatase